jgi:hypothetical protein
MKGCAQGRDRQVVCLADDGRGYLTATTAGYRNMHTARDKFIPRESVLDKWRYR